MSDCTHERVDRSLGTKMEDSVWVCQPCGLQFVPMVEVERLGDALDTATGMFSAVIWDLMMRKQEEELDPAEAQARLEAICDDLGGHNYDVAGTGACIRCGTNPFLGAQP